MSWSVAALGIVLVTLVAGFAWWERSRPPSRLLALVATLAALAVAGRIAFAPLPNVKPTTDIVFLAGFALGAAPGFATGAIAALASNVFFGQGPWTPWQMVAWGLVGLLGAGLAAVAGRERLGRLALALACGVAALAFGVVMDAYQWLTFQTELDLRSYGVVAATSLPFNLAHIIASIVFCFAFGPALAGALSRFRTRLDVTWSAAPAAASVALLAVVAGAALSAPSDAEAAAPKASVRFLERAQNADGGFGAAPGAGSTGLHSGWAALGLAAAGVNPADVKRPGGKSLAGYLAASPSSTSDVGAIERTILAVTAAGLNPRSVGGKDLVARLAAKQRANGSISGRVNTTSYGVLALKAAGGRASGVRRGAAWVARQQNRDGGFSFATKGAASGIDDTAGAVQALVAGGRAGSKPVRRAVRFLLRRQNADGGFPLQPGGASNAQSTAFAIQGLVAAGRAPRNVRRKGSRAPDAFLRSLMDTNGSIRYSRTSAQTPVWVTAQAVAALAARPLPIAAVARRPVARAATPAPTAAAATATAAPPADAPAEKRHRTPGAGAKAPNHDVAAAALPDMGLIGAAVGRIVTLLLAR